MDIENLILPIEPSDHPDCQAMSWSQSEIRAIKQYAAKCIKSLIAELETLRAENAKLIAERDGFEESYRDLFNKRSSRVVHLMDAVDKKLSEINCTEHIRKTVYESIRFYGCGEVADLKLKTELLEAERDALLAERETMMKQEPVGYKIYDAKNKSEWITTIQNPEKYRRDYPDFILTPIYASPLPAQQIPEGYALVPIEPTKMMAEAMEYEAAGFDWPEPYWQNILAAASASQPKGDV